MYAQAITNKFPFSPTSFTNTPTCSVSSPRHTPFPPAMPQTLPLTVTGIPGWELITPLPVTIEQDEDGSYIASDRVFNIYGNDWTLKGAIDDYIESLVEYYELLSESAERHPPSSSQFAHLKQYLRHTTQR